MAANLFHTKHIDFVLCLQNRVKQFYTKLPNSKSSVLDKLATSFEKWNTA